MMEQKHSPQYFAGWAFAGAALLLGVWISLLLCIPKLRTLRPGFVVNPWSAVLPASIFVVGSAIGYLVPLWAEKKLTRGYFDGVWAEAELMPVRALLRSRILKGVMLIIVTSGCIFAWTSYGAEAALISLVILLLPLQTMARMQRLLAPRQGVGALFPPGEDFPPIHSEHWGKPPRHG